VTGLRDSSLLISSRETAPKGRDASSPMMVDPSLLGGLQFKNKINIEIHETKILALGETLCSVEFRVYLNGMCMVFHHLPTGERKLVVLE
jgi:hypothetical protein